MPKWNSLSRLNPMNWGKKSSSLASNDDPIQPPSIQMSPTPPNYGRPQNNNYAGAYGGSGSRGGYANNPYDNSRFTSQQTGYDTGPYPTGPLPNHGPGMPGGGNAYAGGAQNGFYGPASAPGGASPTGNPGGGYHRTADQRAGGYKGYDAGAYGGGGNSSNYDYNAPQGYNSGGLDGGAMPSGPGAGSYQPPTSGGGYGAGSGYDAGSYGGGYQGSAVEPTGDVESQPADEVASTARLPQSLVQRSGSYTPGSTGRTDQLASLAGTSTFRGTETGTSPASFPESGSDFAASKNSTFPLY